MSPASHFALRFYGMITSDLAIQFLTAKPVCDVSRHLGQVDIDAV